ncbi:lipoprotein N-acyltransferase Lnb domain-containing protein [Ekhidna sp. To15]|uniref:lipoprotein N-acyltransferase Lnb domain-containing protein n=1 Tax=Ekhidna sp. To15 TaxID=3395267 RepID=UPI003F51E8FE
MRFVFLSLLFLVTSFSQAQIKLSEQAEIAVITIGPYQGEVWSAFGHSGIRVVDPNSGVDWFYNYGLYDFDQENFFLNFAQGLLKYKVGVGRYDRVYAFYKSQNRYVKEQYLNLTAEEKQQFFDFLQTNVKPENAEYLYNYVYDNCATKIRDVAENLYPNRIEFDLSYKEEGKTIRDLMDDYLDYQPWGDFAIDLGLGQQIDKEATAYDYMFLPDYVHSAFSGATIDRDSLKVPLVKREETTFVPEEEAFVNGLLTPFNTFVLLFFIVGLITHRNMKYGKRTKWVDSLIFSLVGFAGWWVVFLWFGTEHLSQRNLNILWAIPFHFPLVFFTSRKRFRNFFRIYFKVAAYWYCGLLLIWALLLQPLHQSLVPLVLTMVLRSFYISYDLRKQKS